MHDPNLDRDRNRSSQPEEQPEGSNAFLVACMSCGRLHRPERPLDFHPRCGPCRARRATSWLWS